MTTRPLDRWLCVVLEIPNVTNMSGNSMERRLGMLREGGAALQRSLRQKQRCPSPGRDSPIQTSDIGICMFRLEAQVRM